MRLAPRAAIANVFGSQDRNAPPRQDHTCSPNSPVGFTTMAAADAVRAMCGMQGDEGQSSMDQAPAYALPTHNY